MEIRDVARVAEDAAYVTIGFGVLAFQKAQVRRREIAQQLDEQRQQLGVQVTKLAQEIEERFEPVVDGVEDLLPGPAKQALQQARKAAKDAQAQFRSRTTPTPAAA